jgi:hypothetical protein
MSIKYCSWATGSDSTGDGSAGNPYKTITKASESLTGGDEVRVEKSSANVALTGTLTFVRESTDVVGIDTLFTEELSVNDFIIGADGYWYKVTSIDDDTNLSIGQYIGADASDFASSKINFIVITGGFIISSSGISSLNRLKISGGWNLTSETQTGETIFKSDVSDPALYNSDKNYLEISKLSFIDFNGSYVVDEDNLGGCVSISYGYFGSGISVFDKDELSNMTLVDGINCYGGEDNNSVVTATDTLIFGGRFIAGGTLTLDTCIAYGTSLAGGTAYIFKDCTLSGIKRDSDFANYINFDNCTLIGYGSDTSDFQVGLMIMKDVTLNKICLDIQAPIQNAGQIWATELRADNLIINDNTENPNTIYFGRFRKAVINGLSMSNGNVGIYFTDIVDVTINGFTTTGYTTDVVIDWDNYNYDKTFVLNNENPIIRIQNLNGTNNTCYYGNGIASSDTVEARSGTCLKMSPTSATVYIAQKFYFKAASGVAKTLKFYIKKDGTFDGDVKADVRFVGNLVADNQNIPVTTSYVQNSVVVSSGSITEDGVIELTLKVRGTTGNIYIDDFSV